MKSIKLDVNTECGKLLLQANRLINGRGHIVGGSLRSYFEGNIPKDIDVFCSSIEMYDELILDLTSTYNTIGTSRIGYISLDFEFHGSILSIIKPTQLYGRYTYGNLQDLIEDIDINICRLGLNRHGYVVTTDFIDDIIKSIKDRKFHFVKIRQGELERNIVRIKKYEGYGYKHSIKGE